MPSLDIPSLIRRQYCSGYGYNDNCDYSYNSPWDIYGRWILLAAIIIGAFLIFLTFSCITARRRKRMNLRPYPMTGWAYQGGYQGGQPQYGNNQQWNQAPPPAYGQPANAGYYGNKDGMGNMQTEGTGYAGQQSGVELQEPSSAYQPQHGGDNVYQAPPGPPPGKGDGIIR